MAMKAAVFDFGYTLVNEDRVWREIVVAETGCSAGQRSMTPIPDLASIPA